MATAGICTVRDAADIVGPVVEHMLGQVDFVIVADNLSTDGTRDILDALPVVVVDDREPAHYQSAKMTCLARMAGEAGADWVVPFDADEAWYSPFGRLGNILDGTAPQWLVLSAALYDHVVTTDDPPDDPNPLTRVGWRRREAAPLPKIACRIRSDLVIADGNHRAHYDGGPTELPGWLVVRHYPYRSPAQFVAKALAGAAALDIGDIDPDVGRHWRDYAALIKAGGTEAGVQVFYEHFHSADPASDASLIFDPAPCSAAISYDDRDDLGDGRCTNHPARCMIPGCDHAAEPQATRDRERWGVVPAS